MKALLKRLPNVKELEDVIITRIRNLPSEEKVEVLKYLDQKLHPKK